MRFFVLLLLSVTSVFLTAQSIEYPKTSAIPIENTYHGVTVVDDYRWLEKLHNDETWAWKDAQNDCTKKYMKKLGSSSDFWNEIYSFSRAKYSLPEKKGLYFFQLARDNIYLSYSPLGAPKPVLNNNTRFTESTISITKYSLSKDSRYLAYQVTERGSDWAEIRIVDLKTFREFPDRLKNVRLSEINWRKNGFFYTRFPKEHTIGQVKGMEVYYHVVKTPQSEDLCIVKRPPSSNSWFRLKTSSDERYLIVQEYDIDTYYGKISYLDFEHPEKKMQTLRDSLRYSLDVLDYKNGKFIGRTYQEGNNEMLVTLDPETKKVSVLIDEREEVLLDVIPLKDKVLCVYQYDMKEKVICYDYEGNELNVLNVPKGWSVHGFKGNPEDNKLLFHYTTYTVPPVLYSYNVNTYETSVERRTTVSYNVKDYDWDVKQYKSKDGTDVSLMVLYEKGMKQNGKNPTILKAYGGFGVVTRPMFSPDVVAFLNMGGVYAFANIRGGGDKGRYWIREGRGLSKQNSFDDFIAAAEYLIAEKYTSSENLAITGASNGGLVVGAAMTQRPELFAASVPIVGVFDLMRHEKYTVGHFHKEEYGTVQKEKSFRYMYNYSPYHNVKEDVNYPPTLVMTSEYDDRVLPIHSFKFAAKLQNNPAQTNPILLRVEKNAGHSGPSNLADQLKAWEAMYSFIMYHIK